MTFRVTILGCSSARPTATRHHTAHVLNVHEQFFLIDCGEGTQYQLLRCGINPLKINVIFISHLHGDHVYGIFGLLSTMSMMGRTRRLEIIAPHPFGEMLRSHLGFFGVELPYPLEIKEVDTRQNTDVWSNRVFSVSSLPLRHRVPCCGYLFREREPGLNVYKHLVEGYGLNPAQIAALKQGRDTLLATGAPLTAREATYRPYAPRSYAYCSDTTPSGKVATLVEGVDLLYHESTYLHQDKALAEKTGHSTALQAARIARRANVRHLLLGHYSARYKSLEPLQDEARSEFPETILGHDGLTLTIEKDHSLRLTRL
ncbi:ribonuclease Z [uncultured Rikenella sp.]|uniref:ribonuclease Z n=1 Tax=uncultured Rikenella sp. TaxID=368003 RepID=UPI0025E51C47|nr:ribonuclease Z [uncultured Rikenella sp.]